MEVRRYREAAHLKKVMEASDRRGMEGVDSNDKIVAKGRRIWNSIEYRNRKAQQRQGRSGGGCGGERVENFG